MTKLITLGIYPNMSLETARKQAVMAMAMIMTGKDPEKGLPKPEKIKAHISTGQTPTFDKIREKTSKKLNEFKGKASEQIDKIKVSETLDKLKERAATKLDEIKQRVEKKAGHTQVTPQAMADKIIQLNRKARIPQEKPKPPEKKTKAPAKKAEPATLKDTFDCTLDKNGLRILWSGLENSDMPPANQLAIKLLIVTAQRHQEVIPARWADFDLVSKWWTIPANFTKNEKKHKIPLNNLALDILRKIKELSGMSAVLFPAPVGATPLDSKTLAEDIQRAQVRFGLKPFTLQDLQDSVVCQMIDNGIPEATMYKLLNEDEPTVFKQKGGKVTDSDMRKALEKLEKQLPKTY
jgi:integrase